MPGLSRTGDSFAPSRPASEQDGKLRPLEYGEELITEYEENCQTCGEQRHRRMYITATKMLVSERTPCSCDAQEEASYLEEQRRRMRSRIQTQWGKINLFAQEGYKHMRFSTYTPVHDSQKQALEYMRAWEPEKGSVCLAGLPGRGKTHLAMAAGAKAAAKGCPVLALKTIDLLARLRRMYQMQKESDVQLIDVLKTVDVLILDDIGAEKATDWVQEVLYEIIDSRYRVRATIFTTNLGGKDMIKKLGDALTSRIYGAEQMLTLEGRDWRVAPGKDEWGDIGEEVFLR